MVSFVAGKQRTLLQHFFGFLSGAVNCVYIPDLDYYSEDAIKPAKIEEGEKLVDFIRMLSEFAEDRLKFGSNANRLLFMLPSDSSKPQRTLVLEGSS